MASSSRQPRTQRSHRDRGQQCDRGRSQRRSIHDDSVYEPPSSRRWSRPLALTIHPGRTESSRSRSTQDSSSNSSWTTSSLRSSRSSSTIRAPPTASFRQLSLANRQPPTASSRQLALINRPLSMASSGLRSSSSSRLRRSQSESGSSVFGDSFFDSQTISTTVTPINATHVRICGNCDRTLHHSHHGYMISQVTERSFATPTFHGSVIGELDNESSDGCGSERASSRRTIRRVLQSIQPGSVNSRSSTERPLMIEAGPRTTSGGAHSVARRARPRNEHASSQGRIARWVRSLLIRRRGGTALAEADDTSSILPGESSATYADRQERRRSRSRNTDRNRRGREGSRRSRSSRRW